MNRIRILPETLANQIAAGEVVERPASVVKELLENALDAGAKRIQIDIELAGRRLMRIADDGAGMNRDDAVLAFERHATSKIRTLEDLGAIETLGFRGEALASIASVAKVELITKTEDCRTATRVQIEGGRIIDVRDTVRSQGTTISVRDLFFNTPARRKFMRSESTENYHLISIVQHYALANPEIAFVLTNNGRESLRLAVAKDLRERAFQVLGRNVLDSLLEVNGGREYVAKVSGYVSAPRERRTTRDSQYFFINGRFVKDKLIARGLMEGYRNILPHGAYPVALLFLEIPIGEIDVNVHPAKTEVRFRRTEAVRDVIAEAVKKTLESSNLLNGQKAWANVGSELNFGRLGSNVSGLKAQVVNEVVENQVIQFPTQTPELNAEYYADLGVRGSNNEAGAVQHPSDSKDFEILVDHKFEDANRLLEKQNSPLPSTSGTELETPVYERLSPIDSAVRATKTIEVEQLNPAKIQPIGQLHESYIIAVDNLGLLLIDQHVAHERILFDKFRQKENDRKIESQNLLLPETFDLTPAQASAFDLIESELEKLGFGLMRLSGRTIAIKATPSDLPPSEVRNLMAEVLDTVDAEKRGNAIETIRDEIAARLACRAAVKINMKLTPEKMQWMIDNLATNSAATTCPHGRPIVLRLTMRDIERSFHRS